MDIEWELLTEYYPYVHIVRDKIVKKALKKDYDYLMWLDNDIDFTVEDFKNQEYTAYEFCDILAKKICNQNRKMNLIFPFSILFRILPILLSSCFG